MMTDLFGIDVTVYVALGLTLAIFNQGVFWGKISDSERIGLYRVLFIVVVLALLAKQAANLITD